MRQKVTFPEVFEKFKKITGDSQLKATEKTGNENMLEHTHSSTLSTRMTTPNKRKWLENLMKTGLRDIK